MKKKNHQPKLMDFLRNKRYHDKINYILENLIDLDVSPQNNIEKKGIFYSIQTIIESIIDVISMLVKDLGIPVEDDRKNIEHYCKKLHIGSEMQDNLIKANGMRNILVHRYNGVDEELILDSIGKIKLLVNNWLESFEEVLSKFEVRKNT